MKFAALLRCGRDFREAMCATVGCLKLRNPLRDAERALGGYQGHIKLTRVGFDVARNP